MSTSVAERPASANVKNTGISLVDTDVHPNFETEWTRDLADYFPEEWKIKFGAGARLVNGQASASGYRLPNNIFHPLVEGPMRLDLVGEGGAMPATDPEVVRSDLLDRSGVDRAILLTSDILSIGAIPNPDVASEIVAASNRWMAEKWLSTDQRYRGLINVALQDPDRAVQEILRWRDQPGMVGVFFSINDVALGDRRFDPIYRIAVESDLVVQVHVTGNEGMYETAARLPGGIPYHQMDWRASLPYPYAANIASLVTAGVFEKYPSLRFIVTEAGFSWLPDLMWRMDTIWKSQRSSTPWVRKAPSEYIVEQCRFTTQPLPETETVEQFEQILRMMHAEQTLMFSSDYPHWDWDDPKAALARIPEDMRDAIAFGNAVEAYGARLL